jgi:hypothetical protein
MQNQLSGWYLPWNWPGRGWILVGRCVLGHRRRRQGKGEGEREPAWCSEREWIPTQHHYRTSSLSTTGTRTSLRVNSITRLALSLESTVPITHRLPSD